MGALREYAALPGRGMGVLGMQEAGTQARVGIVGRLALVALCAVLPIWGVHAQTALPSLGSERVRLPDVSVPVDAAVVSVSVALQGDVPTRTFVVARQAEDNLWRTRSADGFWWVWDNLPETVLPTGAAANGDVLTLKVFDESLAGLRLPLEVVVGYDSAAGRKTGYFLVRGTR
jgi:hypothetical protein